jgi:hypothetical protein
MTGAIEEDPILEVYRECARELRGLIKDAERVAADLRAALKEGQAAAETAAKDQIRRFGAEYQKLATKEFEDLGNALREAHETAEKRIFAKFDGLMKMLSTPPRALREATGARDLDELVHMVTRPELSGLISLQLSRAEGPEPVDGVAPMEVRRPKGKGRRKR